MVFMFEIAPPFRLRGKVERFGPMTRVIWGWFSVSYIAAGVNDIARAFRLAEREACAKVCEDHPDGMNMLGGAFVACAAAIRARSNVK
jgi:hypothetical protein